MVGQFLGVEPLDHLSVLTASQDGLKGCHGRSGGLVELSAALLTPLLEQPSIAILLDQPGCRAAAHQVGLDFLLMARERLKTGPQAFLGRLTGPECAGVNLQGLVFATLPKLPEGVDTGSETFHRDTNPDLDMGLFMTIAPRSRPP